MAHFLVFLFWISFDLLFVLIIIFILFVHCFLRFWVFPQKNLCPLYLFLACRRWIEVSSESCKILECDRTSNFDRDYLFVNCFQFSGIWPRIVWFYIVVGCSIFRSNDVLILVNLLAATIVRLIPTTLSGLSSSEFRNLLLLIGLFCKNE